MALPRLRVTVLYDALLTDAYREDNDWLLEPQVELWPCVAGIVAKRDLSASMG